MEEPMMTEAQRDELKSLCHRAAHTEAGPKSLSSHRPSMSRLIPRQGSLKTSRFGVNCTFRANSRRLQKWNSQNFAPLLC